MAEPKTQPTGASVNAYIHALADKRMRNDCHQLVQMMTRVTGAPPVMWGTSIVGFDAYHGTKPPTGPSTQQAARPVRS
jgi:hypothetical protein